MTVQKQRDTYLLVFPVIVAGIVMGLWIEMSAIILVPLVIAASMILFSGVRIQFLLDSLSPKDRLIPSKVRGVLTMDAIFWTSAILIGTNFVLEFLGRWSRAIQLKQVAVSILDLLVFLEVRATLVILAGIVIFLMVHAYRQRYGEVPQVKMHP